MNQGQAWTSPKKIFTADYFSDFSMYFYYQIEGEISLQVSVCLN